MALTLKGVLRKTMRLRQALSVDINMHFLNHVSASDQELQGIWFIQIWEKVCRFVFEPL